MARPRTNRPADSFTSTESSVAAGLPARSHELLMRRGYEGIVPDTAPASDPRFNLWNTHGFKHWALIGSFVGANMPLVAAARLGREVNRELSARYYTLRSNLERYLEKDRNPKHPFHPFDKAKEGGLGCRLPSEDEAFWLHHLLSTTDIYRRNEALAGDFCIEIADKQYVYITCIDALAATSPFGNEKSYLDPQWRIVGWERGNDEAYIRPITDELEKGYWEPGTDAWRAAAAIEREFLDAHKNAVSIVRINISLAIRRAFDRLADYRADSKIPVDLTSTIRPPPGRYDGFFPDGWPVDPAHPSNRDLPPKARVKRLAKIEAYVNKREAEAAKKGGAK